MLQFNVMGFPVTIQWFFWLATVLLGGGLEAHSRQDWIEVALWVWVVFISILIHELGHALAARKFGHFSAIVLHGFGGVTIIPHARFTRKQSIWVSFSGPLAGFILTAITYVIARTVHVENDMFYVFISMMFQVNFFWTLVNLLPVLPMDGGQIFREIVGPSRRHVACIVGAVVATLIAVYAIKTHQIYLALLFGYFAWLNFRDESIRGGIITD